MQNSDFNDRFEKICKAFSSSMSPDDVREFAFSLSEILESAWSLSQEIWTRINAGEMPDEEAEELLSDIQHEIYHIDYHVHSCRHLLPDETPMESELTHGRASSGLIGSEDEGPRNPGQT